MLQKVQLSLNYKHTAWKQHIWLANVPSAHQCVDFRVLCLGTSLTSPAWGQVTGVWMAEAGFPIPRVGDSDRYSKGAELCLLALAMKVSSTVPFPTCSLLTPPDPSWLDRLVRGTGWPERWKIVLHICLLICSCLQLSSVGPCWASIQRTLPQK